MVSTPATKSKEPDLSHIESASKIIIRNIKAGGFVRKPIDINELLQQVAEHIARASSAV